MEILQEIGSYAGLAAIPGLAILSALYFSQARDVRRLREWAGRAPERAAEIAQGGRAPVRAPAQAAQPAQPAARPAAAAATGAAPAAAGGAAAAAATGTATAAPPRAPTPTPSPTPSAPPIGTGGGGPTAPKRIAPRVPAARPSTAAGQTAILGAGAPAQPDRWYRRLPAARYIAVLLVGIAVIGGGIAYGITQLGDDPAGKGEQQAARGDAQPAKKAAPAPVRPSDVTVAVVNGTTVTGLARNTGNELEEDGFKIGNLVTASEGEVAESVVLFKSGANREAQLVARKLGITQIEPADAEALAEGGDADVIVVVGADRATSQ